MVRPLLEKGVDVNVEDSNGKMVIHRAAGARPKTIVWLLVEKAFFFCG